MYRSIIDQRLQHFRNGCLKVRTSFELVAKRIQQCDSLYLSKILLFQFILFPSTLFLVPYFVSAYLFFSIMLIFPFLSSDISGSQCTLDHLSIKKSSIWNSRFFILEFNTLEKKAERVLNDLIKDARLTPEFSQADQEALAS